MKLHGILWDIGNLDYSELPIIPPKDLKADSFAKGTEKC